NAPDDDRADRDRGRACGGTSQAPDRSTPVKGAGGVRVFLGLPWLCSGSNRRLILDLRVIPETPFLQNHFERAVHDDLVDGRIDLGFQRVIAFTQADDVLAARERWSSRTESRI